MKLFKINEAPQYEELIKFFLNNEEILIELYELTNEDKSYISDLLKTILEDIGKDEIYNYMQYIFIELLENAKKANIKRLFFNDKNLNISDSFDYAFGMKKFKDELTREEYYINLLKKNNLYIRVSIKVEDELLIISVINNSLILNQELINAREKIEKARQFNNIEEAYATVDSNTEGAGLGIIITILILKKLGLTRKAFNIYKTREETISSLMLPLSTISVEKNQIINELIVKEIENIPQFPKHIIKLQELLDDYESNINEIKNLISNDPSLVAELIKTANSPIFMRQGKVSSIYEAIKIIGFIKIKDLLYTYGIKELFSEIYDQGKMEKIWTHSYKVALFSYYLAKLLPVTEDPDEIYVSAILHDIGRILLLGVNPELINKLTYICQMKSIPIRIIEEITSGYNHAIIGSIIAKKWNFPEKFIHTIKYHNNPLNCEDKYKNSIYCVYLANMLAHDEEPYEIYKQINKSILYFFNIHSFIDYSKILDNLIKLYREGNSK